MILSLLAGFALIVLSLWLRSRTLQSRHWPSTEGVVLESRVDDTHLEFMKPVLRYRYVVGGQQYVGFRVAYVGYGVSRAAMAQLIRGYPAGSSVRVYYDPADPSVAVLNNQAVSDWKYWFAFGVGFLLLALYLAFDTAT